MSGICSEDVCVRTVHAKGLCKQHYDSKYMAGEAGAPGWCSIDGCTLHVYAERLCNKHYQRKLKYGDPMHLKGSPPAFGGCRWLDGSMSPCGAPVGGPSWWCAEHRRKAFGHGAAKI